MDKKDLATLIAVGGVVGLGVALVLGSYFTGQSIPETAITNIISGLIGFAGGGAVLGLTKE